MHIHTHPKIPCKTVGRALWLAGLLGLFGGCGMDFDSGPFPLLSKLGEMAGLDPSVEGVFVSETLPAWPDDGAVGRLVACSMTLVQGSTVLFDANVTITYGDASNESHSSVNVIVPEYSYPLYDGLSNASVYLDVLMSEPGQQGQRNLHLWIWSAKRVDPIKRARHPLLKLSASEKVALHVTNMLFEQPGEPRPVAVYHYPYGDEASALYMLYYGEFDSAYYALPGARRVRIAPGLLTLQVPQSLFLDADSDNYWFEEGAGMTPSVRWDNIPSPTPDTDGLFPVLRTDGSAGSEDGEVFQMALSAVVRRK